MFSLYFSPLCSHFSHENGQCRLPNEQPSSCTTGGPQPVPPSRLTLNRRGKVPLIPPVPSSSAAHSSSNHFTLEIGGRRERKRRTRWSTSAPSSALRSIARKSSGPSPRAEEIPRPPSTPSCKQVPHGPP